VSDGEASMMRRSLPTRGCCAVEYIYIYIYIYIHLFICADGFVSVRNEEWTSGVCIIPKEAFNK
jgi:hypothetical protein